MTPLEFAKHAITFDDDKEDPLRDDEEWSIPWGDLKSLAQEVIRLSEALVGAEKYVTSWRYYMEEVQGDTTDVDEWLQRYGSKK